MEIHRDGLFEIVEIKMAERYQSVNGAWPSGKLPVPTAQEAMSGAKRLYRLAMGRAWKGKWIPTSGRRHTWPKRNVFYVNPDQRGGFGGWKSIVHGVSHYCHRQLHPNQKPHGGSHAFIEKGMIEHVVNSGWLDGKLKRPEKPKADTDVKQLRRQRIMTRIDTWEAKRKRAERALRKLRRQARYYDRMLAA